MPSRTARTGGLGAALLALGIAGAAYAEESPVVIAIQGGKFVPSEVAVPAGKKLKLVVRNRDTTMAEFESSQFHREKTVPPGGEIVLYVGPLNAGTYEFFDDFHPSNRGHLVAK